MTSQGVGHSSFLFIYNLRVKSTCSARSLQTENSRKWVPKGYSIRGYVSTFFAIFSLMKMGCTQLCKCHLCSKEKLCLPKPKGLLLIASWCIVQETRKSGTQANELNVQEIPLRRWSNIIHSRYLESLECACQDRPCINVLWHVWFCLHWWKIVS